MSFSSRDKQFREVPPRRIRKGFDAGYATLTGIACRRFGLSIFAFQDADEKILALSPGE